MSKYKLKKLLKEQKSYDIKNVTPGKQSKRIKLKSLIEQSASNRIFPGTQFANGWIKDGFPKKSFEEGSGENEIWQLKLKSSVTKPIDLFLTAEDKAADNVFTQIRPGESQNIRVKDLIKIAQTKDSTVTDLNDAINFFIEKNSKYFKELKPPKWPGVPRFYRDKSGEIYLMDWENNEKTHWYDIPTIKALGKSYVTKYSNYIGDFNAPWFDNIPLSPTSKSKEPGPDNPEIPYPYDKTLAKITVAVSGNLSSAGFGGTDEDLLVEAVKEIKTPEYWKKVDSGLNSMQKLYEKYGDIDPFASSYWNDEIYYWRNAVAHHKAWKKAVAYFGEKVAYQIFGNSFGIGADLNAIYKYAAIGDYVLTQTGDWTGGFNTMLVGEMDLGPQRDRVLSVLVENKIYTYDSETQTAVSPDGVDGKQKISFWEENQDYTQYDPKNKEQKK